MNGVLALVAATVVSIDIGWQPLADGGYEYIIQIEPHMVGTLAGGQAISSELPRNLRGMRSYRIVVGNEKLPHEGEPLPVEPRPAMPSEAPPADKTVPTPPASSVGNRPPAAGAGAGDVGALPQRNATAETPPALPGPEPDMRSLPPEPRAASADASDAGRDDLPAEPMPPPALDPEPEAKEIPPRMAGYPLGSPAAGHAGKGEADKRGSGSFVFPGATLSSINQPPAEAAPATGDRGTAKAGDANAGAGGPAASPAGVSSSAAVDAKTDVGEPKPWLPLAGAVIALFASLGANLYLGWNTLALRSRYRSLVAQLHAG
jgi:hypothetical protein